MKRNYHNFYCILGASVYYFHSYNKQDPSSAMNTSIARETNSLNVLTLLAAVTTVVTMAYFFAATLLA